MKKINLLLPYYGNFPNYFQLFLDSVGINNQSLHVYLITDIDLSNYIVPKNVHVVDLTLEEIRNRLKFFLKNEFNIQVNINELINNPYKLCDLRPIFFSIFDDILKAITTEYDDYIGWCDCDLIFGNISHFIDLDKNYDVLGIHGHFTAFKNNNTFKFLYQKIENISALVIDNSHHLIDERQFREQLFSTIHRNKLHCFYMHHFFCDITPWQFKSDKSKKLTMEGCEDLIESLRFNRIDKKLIINFSNGSTRETTYAHLQKRSMDVNFDQYGDSFSIYEESFELY